MELNGEARGGLGGKKNWLYGGQERSAGASDGADGYMRDWRLSVCPYGSLRKVVDFIVYRDGNALAYLPHAHHL